MTDLFTSDRLFPRAFFPALGGENGTHKRDGFPRAVAIWLGLAFALALSLLAELAFGGFPLP